MNDVSSLYLFIILRDFFYFCKYDYLLFVKYSSVRCLSSVTVVGVILNDPSVTVDWYSVTVYK